MGSNAVREGDPTLLNNFHFYHLRGPKVQLIDC